MGPNCLFWATFRDWPTDYKAVREIPRSRYSHASTLQHLRARKLVRRTRSVHSRMWAPAKLVSTTMDFRAFVAKAPHLTIPRQRNLVYGGKLLFSNATAKIPKATSQKRHDGFSFLNDENLDNCLSKKKIRLATPALWLSSPHWCMTNSYPRRSSSKRHAKTNALIRRRPVTCVYRDLGISQTKSTYMHLFLDRHTCTDQNKSMQHHTLGSGTAEFQVTWFLSNYRLILFCWVATVFFLTPQLSSTFTSLSRIYLSRIVEKVPKNLSSYAPDQDEGNKQQCN